MESQGQHGQRIDYFPLVCITAFLVCQRTQLIVVTTSVRTWVPSATALASFMCYTMLAKERLTVSKAFTSVALFSRLQEPMSVLPAQVSALLHGEFEPDFILPVFANTTVA